MEIVMNFTLCEDNNANEILTMSENKLIRFRTEKRRKEKNMFQCAFVEKRLGMNHHTMKAKHKKS